MQQSPGHETAPAWAHGLARDWHAGLLHKLIRVLVERACAHLQGQLLHTDLTPAQNAADPIIGKFIASFPDGSCDSICLTGAASGKVSY